MARVHFVKKARKDNPAVKAGQSYYWWKHRYGSKQYSATYPKASQTTSSPFLSEVYAIQEELAVIADPKDLEGLLDRISESRDQCEDSLYNMPDHLQDSSESGQLLQARIDSLDSWYSELDGIDTEIDEELSEEDREKRLAEILEEIQSVECPVEE